MEVYDGFKLEIIFRLVFSNETNTQYTWDVHFNYLSTFINFNLAYLLTIFDYSKAKKFILDEVLLYY